MIDAPGAPKRAAPASAEPAAVTLRGVRREVGRPPVRVLDDVTLSVPRGAVMHLVGPSGAGKSSLVRLVNRLDEPDGGQIAVLGRDLRDWPVRALRRRVAMVFQEPSLLGLTVRENLALPFRFGPSAPPDLEARAADLLTRVGLGPGFLERTAAGLSVGQRQRVALARSLIAGPAVLLLDEPTSGVDPRTAEAMLAQVGALQREQGLTVIMATHRLDEVRQVGGRMAVLIGGRVQACGEVEALLRDPPTAEVAAFLRRPAPAAGAGSESAETGGSAEP